MHLTGTLMKIHNNKGDMPDKENPGQRVSWDFDVLSIWDGEQLIEVKVKGNERSELLGLVVGSHITVDASLPKGIKPVLRSVLETASV